MSNKKYLTKIQLYYDIFNNKPIPAVFNEKKLTISDVFKLLLELTL